MSYETENLQKIVEGALLAAGEALSVAKIQALFEESEVPEKQTINEALVAIQESCVDRGFALVEVASGWRFQVRDELATWVNRLWEEKPQKYTRAFLETLSLIAYRQPLTRGDIEEVRGVAVSSHTIKTLSERGWIKVVGNRDVPGRPALYATTKQFLDYFSLKSLEDLPTLGELRDIDDINNNLDFESTEKLEALVSDSATPTVEEGAAVEKAENTEIDAGDTEKSEEESPGKESFPVEGSESAEVEEESSGKNRVEEDIPEMEPLETEGPESLVDSEDQEEETPGKESFPVEGSESAEVEEESSGKNRVKEDIPEMEQLETEGPESLVDSENQQVDSDQVEANSAEN